MFTLNIGTELEDVLTIISVVASIVVTVYCWRKVTDRRLRALYLGALILLPSYTNWKLFVADGAEMTMAHVYEQWFKHVFFYSGQLCFFLFIVRYFEGGLPREFRGKNKVFAALMTVGYLFLLCNPHSAHAAREMRLSDMQMTFPSIMLYLTDQGMQHVLALLFFFLAIAFVRAHALYSDAGPRTKVIKLFFLANFFFILLHIWEYAVETQHLLPYLSDDIKESIEFIWQYAGLATFTVATMRLKRAEAPAKT